MAAAYSSRRTNASPSTFHQRKPSTPFSSSSSSSSFKQLIPRSSSSSVTSFHGASSNGNGYGSRSVTPGQAGSDSMYAKGGYGGRSPVVFPLPDELIGEPVDSVSRSAGGGDSISVTIRFRPLRYELIC